MVHELREAATRGEKVATIVICGPPDPRLRKALIDR
jgi:hypothetical protein